MCVNTPDGPTAFWIRCSEDFNWSWNQSERIVDWCKLICWWNKVKHFDVFLTYFMYTQADAQNTYWSFFLRGAPLLWRPRTSRRDQFDANTRQRCASRHLKANVFKQFHIISPCFSFTMLCSFMARTLQPVVSRLWTLGTSRLWICGGQLLEVAVTYRNCSFFAFNSSILCLLARSYPVPPTTLPRFAKLLKGKHKS